MHLAQVLLHSQQAQRVGWPYLNGKIGTKNSIGRYLSFVGFESSIGHSLNDFYIKLIL